MAEENDGMDELVSSVFALEGSVDEQVAQLMRFADSLHINTVQLLGQIDLFGKLLGQFAAGLGQRVAEERAAGQELAEREMLTSLQVWLQTELTKSGEPQPAEQAEPGTDAIPAAKIFDEAGLRATGMVEPEDSSRTPQPGDLTIDDLNLSKRVYESLKAGGISRVDELINLTPQELHKPAYRFGVSARAEVSLALRLYGLDIRGYDKSTVGKDEEEE